MATYGWQSRTGSEHFVRKAASSSEVRRARHFRNERLLVIFTYSAQKSQAPLDSSVNAIHLAMGGVASVNFTSSIVFLHSQIVAFIVRPSNEAFVSAPSYFVSVGSGVNNKTKPEENHLEIAPHSGLNNNHFHFNVGLSQIAAWITQHLDHISHG